MSKAKPSSRQAEPPRGNASGERGARRSTQRTGQGADSAMQEMLLRQQQNPRPVVPEALSDKAASRVRGRHG